MWPYFLLVFFIILLQLKGYFTKIKGVNGKFYVGMVILFLFAALRGNGSGDYFTYLIRGENIDSLYDVFYNTTHMEIGYCMLYYIVNLLGLPAQFVIIGMNFISLTCITVFIKKYSDNWCLSLLLFLPLFFQFDMHAARTAVAISISCLGLGYALEKKLFRFILMVLFAMMFHKTALIVLPLYALGYIKVNLISGLFLIGLDMVFVKLVGFDSLAEKLLSFLGLNSFTSKYLSYVANKQYGYEFSLTDPRLLILIGIFVLAVTLIKKKGKREQMLLNCCLANILVQVLFSEHTLMACRLAAFYNIYLILLIPAVMKNLKERFQGYTYKYIGDANFRLCEVGCIAFFSLYACVYIYVCFIATGVDYRLCFVNV